ncbi:MAG: hypothetical protein JJE48_09505, partial [Actinobacteria bacterium]|nr:hypothetical protein [Actinomycetota bacterium]
MDRIETVRRDLVGTPIHLCPERAYLVTDFYKNHADPSEPITVRKARALAYVLQNKSVEIFPGELVVGNAGSSRKSCIMQPELATSFMSQELLWINRRKTNPFKSKLRDRVKLLTRVIPYWLLHSMPSRMFPGPVRFASYVKHQLKPTYYLINEAGGIGHFLPDYEKMLRLGTSGYLETFKEKKGDIYDAARIACGALEDWAGRFADRAGSLAHAEVDPERKSELLEISRICRKVPRYPAETLHEALQSLWLTHLAVNLESLNSAVSFGRIDQYLYPYYQRDIDEGLLTREEALELLLLFSAKATEHVFLLNEMISQYHGGYLVVQAAIVGGTDREGRDAVNQLTYLFLDVMEKHRMRDPNYQARVHSGSPDEYLERALEVAREGYGVPSLFNDGAVVP